MWEINTVLVNNGKQVNALLEDNYEPFAVSTDSWGERIWFKREIKEKPIAFHNQPPMFDKGRSRRTSVKTKGESSS